MRHGVGLTRVFARLRGCPRGTVGHTIRRYHTASRRKIRQNATRGRTCAVLRHEVTVWVGLARYYGTRPQDGSDLRGITAQGHRDASDLRGITAQGYRDGSDRVEATLRGVMVPHGIRPQAFYQSVTVASVIGMVTLISTSPRVMLNTTVEPTRALIIHSVALCVRSAS